MAAVNVKITGQDRLASTLKTAGKDLDDLQDANAAAGELAARDAQPATPYRTGRLAATVRAVREKGGATITAGSPAVGYANVIHYGSAVKHIRAQPWIAAAVVDNQSAIEDIYLENVQAVCDTVKGA